MRMRPSTCVRLSAHDDDDEDDDDDDGARTIILSNRWAVAFSLISAAISPLNGKVSMRYMGLRSGEMQ